jgi:DNA polymerase-1
MATQILYNGVKLTDNPTGPDIENVERIDLGALPMISMMMEIGLPVNPDHFRRMGVGLDWDMERITEKVHSLTGYHINLNSPDQVSDLLFKKLGLKQIRPKFTKGGEKKEARESVEDEVLAAIQHTHEVVPLIQEFKHFSKLKGTYVEPILKLAKPRPTIPTIYPNLGTTTVPSGRLNSWEPNLLAMPNRTARGRELCEGFIAPPGYVYVSVDESQIEPRLAAHLSLDENLIRIYENEEDIYSDFATKAFGLPDERWECIGFSNTTKLGKVCDNKEHISHGWHYPTVHKKDHRFPAKTCTLASIYDVSPKGLLEQMPIVCATCGKEATKHDCNNFVSLWDEAKCQKLITAFYTRYPGVMVDRKKNHAIAMKYGYVWDMWGRILHVQAVRCWLSWIVSAALREVGNFPYQAGAQGTIKLVMAIVHDEFVRDHIYEICKPVLQIHDELLFLVKREFAQEIGELVAYRFENVCRLNVPIKAGVAIADTWGKLAK